MTSQVSSTTSSFGIHKLGEYNYSTIRLTLAFVATSFLYAASGGAMVAASILLKSYIQTPIRQNATLAATILALRPVDLNHGLETGVPVLVAVLLAIPGTITNSRPLLKASSIANILSILVTLAVGLEVWFFTLIERHEYEVLWSTQSVESTRLIQDSFNCCGYNHWQSPAYAVSAACPNDDLAMLKTGCIGPVTTFADNLLNKIFTVLFSSTIFAVISLLAGLILIKRITELQRFRAIDIKKSAL